MKEGQGIVSVRHRSLGEQVREKTEQGWKLVEEEAAGQGNA